MLTGDELSVTDLAQRAGLAYPTAHREVARLRDAGILSERQVGRTRLIRANAESPLVGHQVDALLADARRLASARPKGTWPPEFVGMVEDGPKDGSSPGYIDATLSRGFGSER